MPLEGARYRMKGHVRLAFKGKKVVEAKNMETGATHTPEEFAADDDSTTREPDEVKDTEDFHKLRHKLGKRR